MKIDERLLWMSNGCVMTMNACTLLLLLLLVMIMSLLSVIKNSVEALKIDMTILVSIMA
jgi:hypothetical protein